MFFVLHCEDKPNSAELRSIHHAAHRAYLEEQPIPIHTAGPLMSDDGARMVGSLLILDCGGRQDVEQFIERDPFCNAGLFERVTIFRWDKRH